MAGKRRLTKWAPTLDTREEVAAYLEAALEDGDPDLLTAALGDVARSKGMTEIARASRLVPGIRVE